MMVDVAARENSATITANVYFIVLALCRCKTQLNSAGFAKICTIAIPLIFLGEHFDDSIIQRGLSPQNF